MSDATRENFGHKLRYTPMRDLLRGRVSGRLDFDALIAAMNLSSPTKLLIGRIVRKTKLWPLEKVDVANELIAHFSDGLENGASAEQLIESFGNERTAAKLIRRAKQRNRPLIWHLFRAIWRAIIALIVIYIGMTGYFYLGRPSPKINYIAVLNEPIEKVPQEQRAWPLYRQALIGFGLTNGKDSN
ncbi:MAG TPA: hypothetical protein VKK61_04130, partial [Tepidisphaeraceae bacterium]|nr:hypothetical protein [Tepidisphaeraceae bacterium]